MTFVKSLPYPISILAALVAVACQPKESDLEQHTKACESTCGQAQSECAADPAFADPWTLSCQVACAFDFTDEAEPFAACMDVAGTCDDKDACVGGLPSGTESGFTSDPTNASDPTDPTDAEESSSEDSMTTVDPSTTTDDDETHGDSSTGGVDGPPCCGDSCDDAKVLDCACYYMPTCCEGAWDELCVSSAVANECIEAGCPALADEIVWDCTCDTIDVYCPDDPFVGQIYVSPEVCGLDEAAGLAAAGLACERSGGDCEIGAGSCDCECTATKDGCGPA